jgi:hypothetical protein
MLDYRMYFVLSRLKQTNALDLPSTDLQWMRAFYHTKERDTETE